HRRRCSRMLCVPAAGRSWRRASRVARRWGRRSGRSSSTGRRWPLGPRLRSSPPPARSTSPRSSALRSRAAQRSSATATSTRPSCTRGSPAASAPSACSSSTSRSPAGCCPTARSSSTSTTRPPGRGTPPGSTGSSARTPRSARRWPTASARCPNCSPSASWRWTARCPPRRSPPMSATTFASFSEQAEAKRLLDAALSDGPAHAYLFHGPRGVGKRRIARAFARELLGTSREVHPDLYELEALGEMIRIDAIRELRRDLHMRPFEADRRVYLLHDAHLMNEDAADALLKDLEEPPSYAVIVLVADDLG